MNPAAADFSIREASLSDLKVLVQIIRESFADVALRFGLNKANCPRHPSNCTSEWVESALEKGVTYFLMAKNGAPCGCVAIERADRKVCYLERLAVLPKYRKCGCGRALVDYALSWAWRDGGSRVEIGIISDDLDLKAWYRRVGFVGKKRGSFSPPPLGGGVMALPTAAGHSPFLFP